jgi:hypothetical protein
MQIICIQLRSLVDFHEFSVDTEADTTDISQKSVHVWVCLLPSTVDSIRLKQTSVFLILDPIRIYKSYCSVWERRDYSSNGIQVNYVITLLWV